MPHLNEGEKIDVVPGPYVLVQNSIARLTRRYDTFQAIDDAVDKFKAEFDREPDWDFVQIIVVHTTIEVLVELHEETHCHE